MSQSPQGRVGGWGGAMEPKELCLSFCRFRSVSKLGFAVFPLKYIMNLPFRGLVPPCTCGRPAFGCIAPTCAFPWSVVPGKLFPAFLCFFRNDDRKGKVCKWSNVIWKKVSAKSNLSEKTARCFFFPPFQKIVKTQATHTCKRIKKREKIAAGGYFLHCYLVAP